MNYSYTKESKGYKSEKKLELVNRLIEYTLFPYYGESYKFSLPSDFSNGLPYIETNYYDGDSVTIRRVTDLEGEDGKYLNYVKDHTDKIYDMVMGNIDEDWDSMIRLFINRDEEGKLQLRYTPSRNELFNGESDS